MTFSYYYAHTAPIFRDLEILTIDQLIVHRIGTVMYKFNYGLLPDVLNTMYRKNCEIHSYNTRSMSMFRISSGTQTFSIISARIWNSLMVNLDIDVSLIKFKESLKQYLLNNVLIIKIITVLRETLIIFICKIVYCNVWSNAILCYFNYIVLL